jgi:hypothetical protein
MDGGKPNNPSLREEIANILPQKKEAGSKPAPVPSAPPKSAPAPKPAPAPAAQAKPDDSQKFVLRTMPSDLENLTKGKTPSGFNVEKSGKTTARPSKEIPLTPPPKIELGAKEKAAPMAPPSGLPKPKAAVPPQLPPKVERPKAAPPAAAAPAAPPKKKGGALKVIIAALVLAIVAYGIIWFVFIREAEEPTPSPTPTITPTPTPETGLLRDVFDVPGSFVITSDQTSPLVEMMDSIRAQLVDLNEIKSFVFVDERGDKYDLESALRLLGIDLPGSLTVNLDTSEYVIIVYGQTEEYDSQGNLVVTSGSAARFKRVGIVVEADDVSGAEDAMLAWEDTIIDDLGILLGVEGRTPASNVFGNNTYNGVDVRYKNYPNPDLSIDYAFPSSFVGKNYLVITNSREAIYMSVDKLLGVLGE